MKLTVAQAITMMDTTNVLRAMQIAIRVILLLVIVRLAVQLTPSILLRCSVLVLQINSLTRGQAFAQILLIVAQVFTMMESIIVLAVTVTTVIHAQLEPEYVKIALRLTDTILTMILVTVLTLKLSGSKLMICAMISSLLQVVNTILVQMSTLTVLKIAQSVIQIFLTFQALAQNVN